MSSSITMSVLRGENGKQYGTWQAKEVTGTFTAPRLSVECTLCGNRQQMDVNQWYSVTKGRAIQCANFGSHRQAAPKKAAKEVLTLDVLNKMPADEYKRRLLHEVGFREQAEAILATAPKQMDRKQYLSAKESAERAAKLADEQKMFHRFHRACEQSGHKMPFDGGFAGWLQQTAAQKEECVKFYDLRNRDWRIFPA